MSRRFAVVVTALVGLMFAGCGPSERDGILGGGASESDWRDALGGASLGVVRLRVETCDGLGFGSGFLVNGSQIVTNRHVVEDSVAITAETSSGESLPTTAAMMSQDLDLGVVTLETPRSDALALASVEPVLGDRILVLGYPGGGDFTASGGRMIEVVDGDLYGVEGQLAVSDAHVEPGNSGGPVINSNGQVVGVLSAIEFQDGYAMMVPLDEVRTALSESMQTVGGSCG
jgi:S1-C subfamily serine protease